MNLAYRNVYSITKRGVERGHYRAPTPRLARYLGGAGSIGVETICVRSKGRPVIVFYEPRKP